MFLAQLLIYFEHNKPELDSQKTVQFEQMSVQLKLSRNLIPGSYIQTIQIRPVERRFKAQQNVQFELDSESNRYFKIEPITGYFNQRI